ncbi:hypothetical protein BKA80DRAFT_139664 [Phyllosticta citrichinensis]
MRRHQNTFFFSGLRVNRRAGYLSPPKQIQLTAQKKQLGPVTSPSRAEGACRKQKQQSHLRARGWLASRLSSPPGRGKATPEAHLFKRRRPTRNDFWPAPTTAFSICSETGHARLLLWRARAEYSSQRLLTPAYAFASFFHLFRLRIVPFLSSAIAPRLSLAADGSQSGSTCAPQPCVCCFSAPPRQS